MNKLLKFFSGKKTIIASILGAITAYLASKGIIGPDETLLISTITVLLFGSASVATTRMYNKEKKEVL